jgi:hypothetical protein
MWKDMWFSLVGIGFCGVIVLFNNMLVEMDKRIVVLETKIDFQPANCINLGA